MANVEGLSCSKPVKNYIDNLVTLNRGKSDYEGIVVAVVNNITNVFLMTNRIPYRLNENREKLVRNVNVCTYDLNGSDTEQTFSDLGVFSLGVIYDDPNGKLEQLKRKCNDRGSKPQVYFKRDICG